MTSAPADDRTAPPTLETLRPRGRSVLSVRPWAGLDETARTDQAAVVRLGPGLLAFPGDGLLEELDQVARYAVAVPSASRFQTPKTIPVGQCSIGTSRYLSSLCARNRTSSLLRRACLSTTRRKSTWPFHLRLMERPKRWLLRPDDGCDRRPCCRNPCRGRRRAGASGPVPPGPTGRANRQPGDPCRVSTGQPQWYRQTEARVMGRVRPLPPVGDLERADRVRRPGLCVKCDCDAQGPEFTPIGIQTV